MIEAPEVPVDRPVRIIIGAVQIPFITGGAESHIESLRRELIRRGYEVDVVRLPLKWYPPRQIINDALAWRYLDLTHSYGLPVDLFIGTRFPAYVARHPRKVAWVLHQHRQAYDLLNTALTDFKDTPDDDHVRGLIYDMDRSSLGECQRIFTNSANVTARMQKFLGIASEPLYHPPPLAGRYYCESYDDYVLSVGRLEVNKRVDLLLKSLAETRHPVEAVIAGKGPQEQALKKLTAELGLNDRVHFLGFVDDDHLLELYARCGAVFYAPLDEDYGYITLEALLSGKSVITAADSGGVLEFIEDRKTGLVGHPNPQSLAIQIDEMFDLNDRGREMALRGRSVVEKISWDDVIQRLTACLREPNPAGLKNLQPESRK